MNLIEKREALYTLSEFLEKLSSFLILRNLLEKGSVDNEYGCKVWAMII